MSWAAFCIAFYGFLRASKLCAPGSHSFYPACTLCLAYLTITSSFVYILIKASKIDPFCTTCTITLGETLTSTCPVALRKYLHCTHLSPSTPLFQFHDRSFLTCTSLTAHLHSLLRSSGTDPATFASHSFCIGVATTAAAASLPDWQVQALGRWTSDCYMCYIRLSPATLASASVALASSTH